MSAKTICSIEGCDRDVRARGWCSKHWQRWSKYGDPEHARVRTATPEEAFSLRTRPENGCLIWTGARSVGGYGKISVGGKSVRAHRYAWERAHGPIPDGMLVDHICHDRACVEVEHLRLATSQQNVRHREGASPRNRNTGVRNVQKRGGRYYVVICVNGRNEYFGSYVNLDEAAVAAEAKRGELFGEFAGGSSAARRDEEKRDG